jgi:hypothetical protein
VSVVLDRLNISNHCRSALTLEGSNSNGANSFAAGLGCSAMDISGGDEATLARGNNLVVNNTIERCARTIRTYTPAIGWSGVGNTNSGDTIGNSPPYGEFICHAVLLRVGCWIVLGYCRLSVSVPPHGVP